MVLLNNHNILINLNSTSEWIWDGNLFDCPGGQSILELDEGM